MDSKQNFLFNQKYIMEKKLGEGGFGSVYKVFNKDDKNYYAIKQISIKGMDQKQLDFIEKEAKILSSIENDNIVKFYDSFIENDTFNIVMEFCDLMDFRYLINQAKKRNEVIDENIIYYFTKQICLGLKEIHKKNLIHRDLKPDNIFITSDFQIKIGDFGVAKQLNNKNEKTKTQIGTILYMAPEIINGEYYNYKVDIWALGCIIYELCTLNYYYEKNNTKINSLLYQKKLQDLINKLLNKDYNKRPDIKEIIELIEKVIDKKDTQKIIRALDKRGVNRNYLIEKSINQSLEQMEENIFQKERNKFLGKDRYILAAIFSPAYLYFSFLGTLGTIFGSFALLIPLSIISLFLIKRRINNSEFIKENSIIIQYIEQKIFIEILNQLDKNISKQKLIIFNKEKFEDIIEKIKQILISEKYLNRLKGIERNNFNILLLGSTHAGKSTLINEFLELNEGRAKEGDAGVPTQTIDFIPYKKEKNGIQYTLLDTNGITNEGVDSINNKIKNTIDNISLRIKNKNPNDLIHCIWYCKSTSEFQESDKNFINDLLKIYIDYSIPIIFIHTYSLSKKKSETCKKGLENVLKRIFNNDESKVQNYLNNFIRILAREDDEKQSFGLKDLEELTAKKIKEEGFKSSYYEYIRQDILPILISGAFDLIFTEDSMKTLNSNACEDLNKYYNSILSIINGDQLNLGEKIKKENKKSLNKIYNTFRDIKDKILEKLKDKLTLNNLKKDNEDIIKKIYEFKSEEYKNKYNINEHCKKVEKLIFESISDSSNKIINNMMNISFNAYIMKDIRESVKNEFQDIQLKAISDIYNELLKINK